MATTEVQEYRDRLKELQEEREQSLNALCLDVSEYICPSRGRFEGDDRSPDRMHAYRGSKIIDSTPQDAHNTATNGMHSGLTPSSSPWLKLEFEDDQLMKYGPAKDWLDTLTKRVYSVLRRSNFYSSIRSVYAEIIAFANACMFFQEDMKTGMRFRPMTFGEWWCACDYTGRVDTIYRSTWMPIRQIEQKWGSGKMSESLVPMLETSPLKAVEVIHAVQPRSNYDPRKKDKLNKPWESCYFEASGDDDKILGKGGFETFPYVVGRWDVIGNDSYGTDSPGIQKLPDAKELQDCRKTLIIAQHKEADPPVMAPQSMAGTVIRSHAGGITWYDSSNPEGLKRLYEQKFDFSGALQNVQDIRERIRHGFFSDIFMMIQALESQRGGVTATQIMEMKAEKLEQLGPFVQRAEDEILDPIIEATVASIMNNPEQFSMPQPPEEISGTSYRIEYIGILAQAQKQIGKTAIDDMTSYVMNIAQADPTAWDVFDKDEAIRARGEMVGLPPKIIRSQDQIVEIRKAREEQQAQQKAAIEAEQVLGGAKSLADTKLNKDDPSALTEILKGLGAESMQ